MFELKMFEMSKSFFVEVNGCRMKVREKEVGKFIESPCERCCFDDVLRRQGRSVNPKRCLERVCCMGHLREDRKSVYYVKVKCRAEETES